MERTPYNPEGLAEALQAQQGSERGTLESSKIRQAVLAAILAAAPQLSCSADIDESRPADLGDPTSVEQVEKGKGEVHLSFDGYDWYFQGTYPESFELQVFASNEPVMPKPEHTEEDLIYRENVAVDDTGRFQLREYTGTDETVWVTIKAFQQDGHEITISPEPGPEGMYGVPYAANADKLP